MTKFSILLWSGLLSIMAGCASVSPPSGQAALPLIARQTPVPTQAVPATRALAGGRYVPATPPVKCRFDRSRECIEVDVTNNTLHLYRLDDQGDPVGVMGYLVIAPDPATIPGGLRRGYLERVEYDPVWCPTPTIRRAYTERRQTDPSVPLLPSGCVPAGDPRNAMGDAKYVISGFGPIRIHGTKGYGANWADETTFGCVRLWNDWDKHNAEPEGILELASLHAPKGVEVVFFVQ